MEKKSDNVSSVEVRLKELGLILPEPVKAPPGVKLPFSWVRVRGNRAFISGHPPLNPDGSIAKPLGKVGVEVSLEEGYQAYGPGYLGQSKAYPGRFGPD